MENDKLQTNKRQNRSSFFEEKDSVENNQLDNQPIIKEKAVRKEMACFFLIFSLPFNMCVHRMGMAGTSHSKFRVSSKSKHTKSHDNTARKTICFILERHFQLDDGDDHHVWSKLGQDVLRPNTEYLRCKAARHRYIALFKHPENWTTIVSGNKALFYSALFQIFWPKYLYLAPLWALAIKSGRGVYLFSSF